MNNIYDNKTDFLLTDNVYMKKPNPIAK